MGHMTISPNPLVVVPIYQTTSIPTLTSEVNSMKFTQLKNPWQPGGKKKNKNINFNTKRGTTQTQNNEGDDNTKEDKKSWFPYKICGEDHPTHKALGRMRSINISYYLNPSFPPSVSKNGCIKSFPSTRGNEGTPQYKGSSLNDTIIMCGYITNIQNQSHNYDNPETTLVVQE
jgi:hypothetical protein